jgi:aromatic ring hydroxylase
MLGEVLCYITLTRSTIAGAEARAYDWGAGAFFPHQDLGILRSTMPGWMVRVNEMIQLLGSHHLLATPSLSAFDNPEIGPLLERYLPGAKGISARERAQIMRTAWDFVGSALGGRVELYERFYLASPTRNMMLEHMIAQKTGTWGQVDDFLKESGILPKQ